MTDMQYVRIAGIAAVLTALTTIGVHYVSFPADTLDERLLLPKNNWYLAHRWMIIFHCLLVIVSMLGIALLKFRDSRGLISLGFLFYTVFGITEMIRVFSVLFYLNGLRSKYLETTDDFTRSLLEYSMDQFSLVSITLFTLFAFAFGIANLCYGLVLSASPDRTRWLGNGFLYWALTSFFGVTNDYLHMSWVEGVLEFNGKVFQPVFRLLIGIWLFRFAASKT